MSWSPNVALWAPLESAADDDDGEAREHLRAELRAMRGRASRLASRIEADLPEFTVHDGSHLDALWGVADLVVGGAAVLTPAEVFVLGAAILIHDLGLAVAAYPGGRAELRTLPAWTDELGMTLRAHLGRAPSAGDFEHASAEQRLSADQAVLRQRHAEQAESLGTISWTDSGEILYLITSDDLRRGYGHVIGQVAASHWWSVDELQDRLPPPMGAISGIPSAWTVRPILLACILRCADAIHLSADRAPTWSRLGRVLGPVAQLHWDFQERLTQPQRDGERLVFTSTAPFTPDEADAWWLCCDALRVADRELRDSDVLMTDSQLPRFEARSVRAVDDPVRLAEFVRVQGWVPIDARVEVSDVSRLIAKLGGRALYGYQADVVPIRELIQNASDAELARQSLESEHESRVVLRCGSDSSGGWIEISDEGMGMPPRVLSGALLDFGRSLWDSPELPVVAPGLASTQFRPTGQFGIGFFSVFMWADRVRVSSRARGASASDTWVLEFAHGLAGRPLLRRADAGERMAATGTVVQVWPVRGPLGGAHLGDSDRLTQLANICYRLCPALPVNLWLDAGDDIHPLVAANDWLTIDGAALVRRCSNVGVSDEDALRLGPALRLITDDDGRVVGRIALDSGHGHGVFAYGGLRVASSGAIAGVLEATGVDAARNQGHAQLAREQAAAWATDQALRLSKEVWPILQPGQASVVLELGGHPGPLKVASNGQAMLSLDEICDWAASREEVVITDVVSEVGAWAKSAGVGSYSHSGLDGVLDVSTTHGRIDQIVLTGPAPSHEVSVWDCVLERVVDALSRGEQRATVTSETRAIASLVTPPQFIEGVETSETTVEGTCSVVRPPAPEQTQAPNEGGESAG
jgi:hypothetical protein